MKIDYKKISTLGELKKAAYKSKGIKDELRWNLRDKISKGEETFHGCLLYTSDAADDPTLVLVSVGAGG